jgi:hypothetical protein
MLNFELSLLVHRETGESHEVNQSVLLVHRHMCDHIKKNIEARK